VTHWEYKKIGLNELPRNHDDIDLLCAAGEERWELVAVLSNNVAYMMREIAPAREVAPIEEGERAKRKTMRAAQSCPQRSKRDIAIRRPERHGRGAVGWRFGAGANRRLVKTLRNIVCETRADDGVGLAAADEG